MVKNLYRYIYFLMVNYFTSYPKTRSVIIIILLILIFATSLFIPYMIKPVKEGLAENVTLDIDKYSRFYLDAILDDIAVNDPKMNSLFSIDLLKSVGAGDSFINNTLSDLDLMIPERINMVKEYINWVGDGDKFYQ